MEDNKRIWGQLKIPIQNMEEKEQIDKALTILANLGVETDTGTDGNYYDIELDWSMTKAKLYSREMTCQTCGTKKKLMNYPIFMNGMEYPNYCFCSIICRETYQIEVNKEGGKE